MIGGIPGYNQSMDFFAKFNIKKNRRASSGIEFTIPDEARTNMSIEQYKKYIDDRISRMSNLGNLYFDISDEAYQKMKDDPEYEKAVLSAIQGQIDKMTGNEEPLTMHIGTEEDEIFVDKTFPEPKKSIDDIDEEWWDRRMELMLENIRLNAVISQKRAREQKEITQELVFAERLNSAERQEAILKDGDPNESGIDKNSVYGKAAISAYRTNLLMRDLHI